MTLNYLTSLSKFYTIDNCDITKIGSWESYTFNNCIIRTAQDLSAEIYSFFGNDLIFNNCNFKLADGYTQTEISFIGTDATKIRKFNNCIFEENTVISKFFVYGTWLSCKFNKNFVATSTDTNNLGDILFEKCEFYSTGTLATSSKSYIQFKNCVFNKKPNIAEYSINNVSFVDCIIPE